MASHFSRDNKSYGVREQAALLAKSRPHPIHVANAEELRYRIPFDGSAIQGMPSHIASYTKGLPHDLETGVLVNPNDFQTFIRAMDSGDKFSIKEIPLGPQIPEPRFTSGIAGPGTDVRAWESMGAGNTFDLEGPDAQSVTMPPAPTLDSDELVTEITECYWMALLRDISFSEFSTNNLVCEAVESLNKTRWVELSKHGATVPASLTVPERRRLRGPFTSETVFRGTTRGDDVGPYLSQFLLVGNSGIAGGNKISDGQIQYGAHRVDQRVRVAEKGRDFMTTWQSFMDVQNGADVRGREVYDNDVPFRFIATPRDLATYVHFDALYQAYLNACLILLGMKVPFDKGLPFQLDDDVDRQQTFATFGAPHILSLVTEVATRALKAVRFQKFNVHRRLRPEAVGGLIERFLEDPASDLFSGVQNLCEQLDESLVKTVRKHNKKQNEKSDNGVPRNDDKGAGRTMLMPMAFPEGSPMHPSYGAGHATVAGACVTVLKAFFDHGYELRMKDDEGKMVPFAFVANEDGSELVNEIEKYGNKALTVEGELNKVCSNICIGRNWAGVHYFSDYRESIEIGEKIAIGVLEEQKLTYGENFSMSVPLFDGSVYRI
ncbi:vanadium-dependent bromoperoxidase 1 [Gracilaria domingensis]|nr:vanadium-dependent bromoperoxidase 1 [Gracilaria domingensis]